MYVRQDYSDVLYLVKYSEDNEELKYSLRSLKNLNHGRVFIAGYKPAWVDSRVEHIQCRPGGKKYQSIRTDLLVALNDPRLSEDFVLMNDDFFIMQPTKRMPILRRIENIEHYINLFTKLDPDSYYVKTMREARELLISWGIMDIHSYELHVPMYFNKRKLLALLDKLPEDYPITHIRTIYGNYYDIGGEPVDDVKVINDEQDIPYDGQFVSTSDESFKNGNVGKMLRRKLAKVLVFSHANDPDGLLGVILAQLVFAHTDYLLTNNPQADILDYIAKHDISDYDYIFITDIYPGRPVFAALPDAYWFDHKQSSIDKIQQHGLELPQAGVRAKVNGRPTSASELFFLWLRAEGLINKAPADFVEYIRKIDNWDFA